MFSLQRVVFVKPRHRYGSYADYWRLVELNNFNWCYDDEMIVQDASKIYILTWFSAQGTGWQGAKAHIIVWNFEWSAHHFEFPGVAEWWSPDAAFAAQNNWRYVPCGGDARLNPNPDVRRFASYDVALMMYRDVARRASLIDLLQRFSVKIAPNGWDRTRHLALNQSRLQLHIHQHGNVPAVSPLRFAVAAAYRLPLVAESLANAGIFEDTIIQANYNQLVDTTIDWLRRPSELYAYGALLYNKLCHNHTFKKCLEAAL